MSARRVTAAQSSLLVAMRQGVTVVLLVRGEKPYAYLVRKGEPGVTHIALALERSGHIERVQVKPYAWEFRLTEKGKKP